MPLDCDTSLYHSLTKLLIAQFAAALRLAAPVVTYRALATSTMEVGGSCQRLQLAVNILCSAVLLAGDKTQSQLHAGVGEC